MVAEHFSHPRYIFFLIFKSRTGGVFADHRSHWRGYRHYPQYRAGAKVDRVALSFQQNANRLAAVLRPRIETSHLDASKTPTQLAAVPS